MTKSLVNSYKCACLVTNSSVISSSGNLLVKKIDSAWIECAAKYAQVRLFLHIDINVYFLLQIIELKEIDKVSTSQKTPESIFAFKLSEVKMELIIFKRNVFEMRRRPKGVLRPKMKPLLKDIVTVCTCELRTGAYSNMDIKREFRHTTFTKMEC